MAQHPRSTLPEDPEYWEGLARRIHADAAGPLAAYAAAPAEAAADVLGWYEVLSGRAAWLVAASAAAMLVIWLTLPSPEASRAFRWIERSLSPAESAGSLISGSTPPRVDTLLVQFVGSFDEGNH